MKRIKLSVNILKYDPLSNGFLSNAHNVLPTKFSSLHLHFIVIQRGYKECCDTFLLLQDGKKQEL